MAKPVPFPLEPPIERQVLRRLRFELRKKVPSVGLGAHLHRRMGQSLEFREYRDYTFGDDIRTVDWAASARKGRDWDLVAKSFEAEERRTLIILLDCRPAMRLPVAAPKLAIVAWIAGCLIDIALEEKDRVIVAPVFAGPRGGGAIKIDGKAGLQKLRDLVARALNAPMTQSDWDAVPTAGLRALEPVLKPAAAVVMITDALFDDPDNGFANFARLAQKSFRTFHMVEIDSWPHEQTLLTAMPFKLQAMAGKAFEDQLSEAPSGFLDSVATGLATQKDALRRRCSGPGLIWPHEPLRYPMSDRLETEAIRNWFRTEFPKAPFVGSLLSRSG